MNRLALLTSTEAPFAAKGQNAGQRAKSLPQSARSSARRCQIWVDFEKSKNGRSFPTSRWPRSAPQLSCERRHPPRRAGRPAAGSRSTEDGVEAWGAVGAPDTPIACSQNRCPTCCNEKRLIHQWRLTNTPSATPAFSSASDRSNRAVRLRVKAIAVRLASILWMRSESHVMQRKR